MPTELPKCPMCGARGIYIDEDHPDGYAPCGCDAGLPSYPKARLSGRRISDELKERILNALDQVVAGANIPYAEIARLQQELSQLAEGE